MVNGNHNLTAKSKEILSALRKNDRLSLTSLSYILKVSKVAVIKRLKPLEKSRLVERTTIKSGRGRPQIYYSLTSTGNNVFPRNYADIVTETLRYVDEHLGRDHVRNILTIREQKLVEPYANDLDSINLEKRIDKLSSLRESEGYMPQWSKKSNESFEFLEFNCPIIAISGKYIEACQAEKNLFSKVLDAEVESTHKIVEGSRACRFLIMDRDDAIRTRP
ncbi:MAG: helix-turn-helix transcriptional regulator [Thermoplasmata archaeon]